MALLGDNIPFFPGRLEDEVKSVKALVSKSDRIAFSRFMDNLNTLMGQEQDDRAEYEAQEIANMRGEAD